MADFLSLLLGTLPRIIDNFQGGADPYRQQQEALAAQQAQYAQAAANPDSALYKKTYNQYQDQNKLNLAQVIAEAQGQNRLNSRMGRTPLFSNERGGENLFRSLMQGYQGVGAQSDKQTQEALKGGADIGHQAAAQYNVASPWTSMGTLQKNVLGYQGLANLFSGQPSVGSLGGGSYGSMTGKPQNADDYLNQRANWNGYTY